MSTLIKIRRGNKEDMPALSVGELAFAVDTRELYTGTQEGNVLLTRDLHAFVSEYEAFKDEALPVLSELTALREDLSNEDFQTMVNDAKNIYVQTDKALATSEDVEQRFNLVIQASGEDVPEVMDARMGEQTLRAYNQKVAAQLADKANRTEVREDTSVRPINVAEMDTDTKALFTGGAVAVVGKNSVGYENVKFGAIPPEATTFVKIGKNKFDGQFTPWQVGGAYGDLNGLVIQPASTGFGTAVIRMEPNKTYTITKSEGGNRFRVGLMNNYPVPTSTGVRFDTPLYHAQDENTNTNQTFTFTNTAEGMYLLVYVGRTLGVKLQVEEGSTPTEYEEYKASLSEKVLITSDIPLSADVYDLVRNNREWIKGWELGTFASFNGLESPANNRVRTGFIKMEAGQSIETINKLNTQGFYVHEYTQATGDSFIGTSGRYVDEYIATEDVYVRIVTKHPDDSAITDPKIFDGDFGFNFSHKEGYVSNKPILFGDFTTLYKTTPIEGMSVGSNFDLGASQIDAIYSRYDALMSVYPDIITRRLLGYGSDANGENDTTIPIYEYTISPAGGTGTLTHGTRPVKIMLMTGLHGEEKSTVWSTLDFFTQMMENWKTNDTLASIKANVLFKLIPIANPYGYNTHQRLNARGIDINRNFSYNWDAETATTKGASPYSEIETLILRDWMIEHNDADMFIDFHNFTMEKPSLSYIDTMNKSLQNVYTSLIRRLSDVWRRDYTLDNDNALYGSISVDARPMTFREAYHVAGIDLSTIIEITRVWGGVKYTKEIMEMGADLIGNYILALLNAYDRIR